MIKAVEFKITHPESGTPRGIFVLMDDGSVWFRGAPGYVPERWESLGKPELPTDAAISARPSSTPTPTKGTPINKS